MTKFALCRPPAPLEREDQQALFQWLWHQRYEGERIWEYAFAIPNGSYLHGTMSQRAMQSQALKNQGVRNGVPDIMVAIPMGPYHGLWIEMKRLGASVGTVKDDQRMWHERLRGKGYAVHVCFGLSAAMDAVKSYFKLGVTL